MNKAILIGRVGKDPEIRQTDNSKVAKFSMATSEKWKDKQGEQKEDTTWHNVVVWGKLADVVESWVKKGMLLMVSGKIINRSYESDGVTKYITEINCYELEMLSKVDSGDAQKVEAAAPIFTEKPLPTDNDLPF
jgi:single-strand DNA-binding protein